MKTKINNLIEKSSVFYNSGKVKGLKFEQDGDNLIIYNAKVISNYEKTKEILTEILKRNEKLSIERIENNFLCQRWLLSNKMKNKDFQCNMTKDLTKKEKMLLSIFRRRCHYEKKKQK